MSTLPTPRLHDLIDALDTAHPEPLARLSGAVEVAQQLGDVADSLVGHYVDQARRSGATWTQIGSSMGVSKQAAQKRFVSGAAQPSASSATPSDRGFHRFTDEARAVVVGSQNQAHAGHHDRIVLGHLVLALLGGGQGPAAAVLRAAGLDAARAAEVTSASLPGPAPVVPALVPFDDLAKAVLERSFAEAERLGSDVVDAGHLLLAVLAVEDGTGVLAGLGLTRTAVEAQLQVARSGGVSSGQETSPST